MPTRITGYNLDNKLEFYCVEDPKKVIEFLGPRYNIGVYKSLSFKDGEIIIGNPGLSIEKAFDEKGFRINGNLREFVCGLEPVNPFLGKKDPIEYFIGTYLIDKEIISPGVATNTFNGKIISELGERKIIDYMKTRKNEKDLSKEEKLNDLLDYGKAIFKNDFCLRDIEVMSENLASRISKSFIPTPRYFSNLRTKTDFD